MNIFKYLNCNIKYDKINSESIYKSSNIYMVLGIIEVKTCVLENNCHL